MNSKRKLQEEAFLDLVKTRKKGLEELIEKKEKELRSVPSGHLRICDRKTYVEYYLRDEAKEKNGKYIPKKKIQYVKKLAQKDYDIKVLDAANNELNKVTEYIGVLENNQLTSIYSKLSKPRQALITPISLPDEEFVSQWLAQEYEPMPFTDGATEFYSNAGVRVRSKSELMIANMLEQKGIPYRYEFPISIKELGQVRSDFTCLNVRTRQEFIWEHFGMMDNIAYANKNISKIGAYEQSGYYPGKNMIMTFETSQHALSSNIINAMIVQYLI